MLAALVIHNLPTIQRRPTVLRAVPTPAPGTYSYFPGVISCLKCRRIFGSGGPGLVGLKAHTKGFHNDVTTVANFLAQFPKTKKVRDNWSWEAHLAVNARNTLACHASAQQALCQCHHADGAHIGGICTAITTRGSVCECTEFYPLGARRPRGAGKADALRRAISLDAPLAADTTHTLLQAIPYYEHAYEDVA